MSRAVNLVDVSMFDGSRYSFWSFVGEGFDLETLDELRSIEEDEITTGEGGRRASELSEVPVPGTAMGDAPESATIRTANAVEVVEKGAGATGGWNDGGRPKLSRHPLSSSP